MILTLRPVELTDCALLFQWRNDARTRGWFGNHQPITWKAHQEWFATRYLDSAPWWIGVVDKRPVGYVRFDGGDGHHDVSVTVDPALRGKGLGTVMLKAAIKQSQSALHAFILTGNEASEKLFARCGFKCVGTEWRLR